MKKKSFLTYMEKDSPENDGFVFYADKRCLSDEKYQFSREHPNLHWHDYFELEIVLEGEGTHFFNDTVYDLGIGSAYIVTPIDFHSVVFSGGGNGNVVHIQFDSFTMSEEVTGLITSASSPITAKFEKDELDFVKALSEKLLDEYEGDSPDRKFMIRAILEQLCIMMIRKSEPVSAAGKPRAHDETILQVVNYLNYNFRGKITLSSVADKFILNPNYLGEKFKKTLGLSFSSYVSDLRLAYSLKLLKNSDLSIKQISEESGFSSVSYFIKLFAEKYGISPQRMRRQK